MYIKQMKKGEAENENWLTHRPIAGQVVVFLSMDF